MDAYADSGPRADGDIKRPQSNTHAREPFHAHSTQGHMLSMYTQLFWTSAISLKNMPVHTLAMQRKDSGYGPML